MTTQLVAFLCGAFCGLLFGGIGAAIAYQKGKVQGLAKGFEVAILILSAMTQKEREIIKKRLRTQVELKEQIEKRTSTEVTGSGESGKRV